MATTIPPPGSATTNDPPRAVVPDLPNDNYATVTVNDVTMVLSSGQIDIDEKLDFDTTSYMLYAETITLTSTKELNFTISHPGKHISLFCNTLLILDCPNFTIDVSGTAGADGKPDSSKQPTKGLAAGSITLYVERLDTAQVGRDQLGGSTGLYLNALGGRGGQGITFDGNSGLAGGDGAHGGAGGNIQVYFGSLAIAVGTRLSAILTDTTSSWVAKVSAASKTIPGMTDLMGTGDLARSQSEVFATTITSYVTLIAALQSLSTSMAVLANPRRKSTPTLLESVEKLQGVLNTFMTSPTAPAAANGPSDAINNIAVAVTAVLSVPSGRDKETTEQDLEKAINSNLGAFSPNAENALEKAITRAYIACTICASSVNDQLTMVASNANGGKGGPTGQGDINVAVGMRGEDGSPGMVGVSAMTFQGNSSDLAVEHVLAQPDQAQMLLAIADNLYFSQAPVDDSKDDAKVDQKDDQKNDITKVNNRDIAAQYYQLLCDRLAFVPPLVAASNAPKKPALFDAYNKMEFDDKLTVNALNQLQNVHSRAVANLGQILLGNDMFGHSLAWAPRLSYSYYDARATKLISALQEVESVYSDYTTHLKGDRDVAKIFDRGLKASEISGDEVTKQIDLITDPNGPLHMYSSQIAAFTPLLKAKRQEVLEYIHTIIHLIDQQTFNFDPSTWINCLSTIAMAPSELNAAVSVFQAGYSSTNQITALDKTKFDRTYVVNQLEQCNGTLESLKEAYTNRSDGSKEVDDPGAAKIIMLQTDIDKLVDNFQTAIDQSIRDEVKRVLADYIALIKQRNDAVIALNSTLQLLFRAKQDQAYYENQHSVLGQQKLEIDPTLPSVCYWLKKSCTDMALLVLQTLNYGAHAVQFWGPLPPMTFDGSGGMPTSDNMLSFQTQLGEYFGRALKTLGSSVASRWPAKGCLGVLYRLTEGELFALKHATVNGTMHSVVLRHLVAPTASTSASESDFAGQANVRVTQVRLWLPGVIVDAIDDGTRPLKCTIIHYGDETIADPNSMVKPYHFVHDQLSIPWRYDTTGITSIEQCGGPHDQVTEEILTGCYTPHAGSAPPGDDVYAPIGPFATWQITVNATYNTGLDMSPVNAAYLEFWGSNAAFQ
ncbi:hypothetical protein QFC22_004953 [Naganishia vaughanmartiniae]|uniref:Uncharacterized protein n=1 Tax=Naganishia vaughanmartiniae TaxID=1424756 RepID=A0ACC2WXP9_9TREE|nr:hypothetical protein QFC22_004953 [Naganishia vaughanmartiniae]